MTRMLVSRFLLLLITLGTAALLASYVGVEKEDRWRMDGTVYEISAFPAGEAWLMIRTSLTGPDSGSAATSTSPHVTALAGRPALDVLPDGVAPTAIVPSTSPFAARAAAGELSWPDVDRVVVRDLSSAPDRATEADLLVPFLSTDSSSLAGVIGGSPAQVDELVQSLRRAGVVVDVVPLPPPWEAAMRRSVHVPLLAVIAGFALLGAQVVWRTTLRSRLLPAVTSHRLVGASPLRAARLGVRPAMLAWTTAAASAGGVWLVAWPRWDAEIGLTGDTALLWSAVLVVDAILILGTTLSTLWVRRAHA